MIPADTPPPSGRRWPGPLLFLLALAANLVRLSHWTPFPDELGYAETAAQMLQRGTIFSDTDMFFPPLFVYLAAVLQWLGVELLLSVRLISAVFGAGAVWALYGLLARTYPWRLALVCSLAMLLFLRLGQYSRLGQPEVIHIFFGLLAFATVIDWTRAPTARGMVATGVLLGAAVWAKEVSLGYSLGVGAYLLAGRAFLGRRFTAGDLGRLVGGFALLVVPLLVLGELGGKSLFFEVSGEKSFDVNAVSLGLVEDLEVTARNTLVMFGLPFELRFVLGVPLMLVAAAMLVVGVARGRSLALLTACYSAVMFAFVAWFHLKGIYYILPAVLMLQATAFCEVAEHLCEGGRRPQYAAAALVVAATLAVNAWGSRELYSTRGDYDHFRTVLVEGVGGDSIVASHTNLFLYISAREELDLELRELFLRPGYDLNWRALRDQRTTALLTKVGYLETLSAEDPAGWSEVRRLFPVELRRGGLIFLLRTPKT